jgi:hypothetical protein
LESEVENFLKEYKHTEEVYRGFDPTLDIEETFSDFKKHHTIIKNAKGKISEKLAFEANDLRRYTGEEYNPDLPDIKPPPFIPPFDLSDFRNPPYIPLEPQDTIKLPNDPLDLPDTRIPPYSPPVLPVSESEGESGNWFWGAVLVTGAILAAPAAAAGAATVGGILVLQGS